MAGFLRNTEADNNTMTVLPGYQDDGDSGDADIGVGLYCQSENVGVGGVGLPRGRGGRGGDCLGGLAGCAGAACEKEKKLPGEMA